jgi:hypothetical protein
MPDILKPDDFDELFADVSIPKRTSHEPASLSLDELISEALRPRATWETTHAVVLLHRQVCDTCGASHVYCDGWYARQKHATDKHASRLVKGKPVGMFPTAKEIHQSSCHICASCADSQIEMSARK